MVICTWAPGKKGRWSVSGRSSSQAGTIDSRAVPLRIEILPSQLVEKSLDAGESLAPAGIAEPAHALDQRGLQRGAVAPPLSESLGMGALEGAAKPDTRIADRDDRDPAAEPAAEGIHLNRDPATGAGVLHNILARLRKRHTESPRRRSLEAQLAVQNARGGLADLLHHLVHVLRSPEPASRRAARRSGPSPRPWAPCRAARTARRRGGRSRPAPSSASRRR